MSEDLHYLSTTDAIGMFRSRELSPVELVWAVIDRAEKIEPYGNVLSGAPEGFGVACTNRSREGGRDADVPR